MKTYLLFLLNIVMMHPFSFSQQNNAVVFDKQGHRGCRGLMPENTIPAMLHALDLGVTTLEMDVVISKDLAVLLSHEPFFNHEITTKPNGEQVLAKEEKQLNLYKMDYAEIKKYDVGTAPHPRFPRQQKLEVHKPMLIEVFDSVRAYCERENIPIPFFNIETKCLPISDNIYHPAPDEFVQLLMEVIQKAGMEKYVTIQSFDFRTLQVLHRQFPGMTTAMLIEDNDRRSIEAQITSLGFRPEVYSPHYKLVTPALIEYCRQRNIKVIPWTVNSKADITRLIQLGVDGIITDYPDLFE